jgi:hypothetical protein
MRATLNRIEEIENYLFGQLNPEEKLSFEQKMTKDEAFMKQVNFQTDLTEGIQRLGLKLDAKKAHKKYKLKRISKSILIVIAVLGAIAAGLFYFNQSDERSETQLEEHIPELSTGIEFDLKDSSCVEANQFLPQQIFKISTTQDTILETSEGLIIYVPADAFDTDMSSVDLLVQEAMTTQDVLIAGLFTETLAGEELETGGMFYIDAYAENERVALKKEVVIDIPANENKPEMLLYEGVKDDQNELKWTNPVAFQRPLKTVDILTLDFYPPAYEPRMNEWGYLYKEFKDSLYYSFGSEFEDNLLTEVNSEAYHLGEKIFKNMCASCHFVNRDLTGPKLKGSRERWIAYSTEENFYAFIKNSISVIESDEYAKQLYEKWGSVMTAQPLTNKQIDWLYEYVENKQEDVQVGSISPTLMFKSLPQMEDVDSVSAVEMNVADDLMRDTPIKCGINPVSVKTIWNQAFNNTNLATAEFEARMPLIHKSCNNEVLELYINNLDKNLSTIDSMAMRMVSGSLRQQFAAFAKKNTGKVANAPGAQKRLKRYYEKKREELSAIVMKAQQEFWEREKEKDEIITQKQSDVNKIRQKNAARLQADESAFIAENCLRSWVCLDHITVRQINHLLGVSLRIEAM